MKKLEIVLHDAKKNPPKVDGYYFVVCADGYITNRLEFSEGKWNCHRDLNGVMHDGYEIKDVIYWAKLITLEEVEGGEDYD